jgi:ADP-dependent NAD(P)H-hydrate dehydratase / NAD(P)H-hydrate epimerase
MMFPEDKTIFFRKKDAVACLPDRPADTHKNDFGYLAVWAGSTGKTGAACLTAAAALRAGAGLVTILCPADAQPVVAAGTLESMTLPLSPDPVQAVDVMTHFLENKKVMVAGPGIGTSDWSRQLLASLFSSFKGILILDADGLNLLSLYPALRDGFNGTLVLTPHVGEMSRLLGKKFTSVTPELIDDTLSYSRKNKAYIVLKSSKTIVINPENNRILVNTTGNSGLAKAGSGDVLSGIIGASIGQNFEAMQRRKKEFDLVRTLGFSVWLHGHAGDLAVKKINKRSLLASDIIHHLGPAFDQLESQGHKKK